MFLYRYFFRNVMPCNSYASDGVLSKSIELELENTITLSD